MPIFSQFGEIVWQRLFNIARILQTTALKLTQGHKTRIRERAAISFVFSAIRLMFLNYTVIYCCLFNVTRFLFSLDESFQSQYGGAANSDLALTAQ